MILELLRLAGRVAGALFAVAAGTALYRAGKLDAEIDARIRAARAAAIAAAQNYGYDSLPVDHAPYFPPAFDPTATSPAAAESVGAVPVVVPFPVSTPAAEGEFANGNVAATLAPMTEPPGTAAGTVPSSGDGAAAGAALGATAAVPLTRKARKAQRRERKAQAREHKRAEIDQMGRGYRAAAVTGITFVTIFTVLAFAFAGFKILTQGEQGKSVSASDVASDFNPGKSNAGTPFGGTEAVAEDPAAEGEAAAAEDTAGGTTSSGGGGETQAAAAPPLLVPPQGTWQYSGSGQEVTTKPIRFEQSETPNAATVKHIDNNCWEFTMTFHSNRFVRDTYCAGTDGSLVQTQTYEESTTDLVVVKITAEINIPCDPPSTYVQYGMQPGTTFNHTCFPSNSEIAGSTTSSGPATFTAEETLNIGGTNVAAYKLTQERVVSGTQNGTETSTTWFSKDNGLPLANERSVHVTSPLPPPLPGTTEYIETGNYTLTSLQPV